MEDHLNMPALSTAHIAPHTVRAELLAMAS
jgi:hypothetical protein